MSARARAARAVCVSAAGINGDRVRMRARIRTARAMSMRTVTGRRAAYCVSMCASACTRCTMTVRRELCNRQRDSRLAAC